jgi:hypothetical protein
VDDAGVLVAGHFTWYEAESVGGLVGGGGIWGGIDNALEGFPSGCFVTGDLDFDIGEKVEIAGQLSGRQAA